MKIRVHTGGTKEFIYDAKEKLKDTKHTRDFKKGYRDWINKPRFVRKFTKPKKRKPIKEIYSKRYKHRLVNKKKKTSNYPVIVFFIFLSIILILFLKSNQREEPLTENVTISENIKVTKYIPDKVSFADYANNLENFKFQTITLPGDLISQLEGTKKAGTIEYYIVDDFENKIKLSTLNRSIYLQIKDYVYESGNNPDFFFNLTGIVRKEFGDVYIDVKKIEEVKRPQKAIQVEVDEQLLDKDQEKFAIVFDENLDESTKLKFDNFISALKTESKEIFKDVKQGSGDSYNTIKSEIEEFFQEENLKDIGYGVVSTGCNYIQIQYNYYTTKEDSIETLNYINNLRSQYGKKSIKFDERVYKLAIARAKDMREYNYLDHTNPSTGECPDNMKDRFGLSSNEYVAENGYGSPEYSEGLCTQIEYKSMTNAVDSWMNSRGHRYNLMYDGHIAGAVGCYKNMCVFLGLNRDRFGEGCHTATEGMVFWAESSLQPGEV